MKAEGVLLNAKLNPRLDFKLWDTKDLSSGNLEKVIKVHQELIVTQIKNIFIIFCQF